MTFIQESEKKVADLRKRQKEFTDAVAKIFDEAVTEVLNERFLKQSFCTHPDLVETKTDSGGSKKCPECGWWCAWGCYDCNPKPPPPYPHLADVEDLVRGLRLTNV